MTARRRRLASAAVAALSVLAACSSGGGGGTEAAGDRSAATDTTDRAGSGAERRRPASTTTPAPTTTTATTAPPAPPEPTVLEAGAQGPRTQALQERLTELRFDPGPADGQFGSKTTMAVWAFQKLHDREPDGKVAPELFDQIQAAAPSTPFRPDGPPTRVEIDLDRQVLLLWQDGALRLVTHVSSGTGERYCDKGRCGRAVTPTGDYRFFRRVDGWRDAPLGMLYNPVYFNGGIAVHGAKSVPAGPASHGCVRIPMHIAEYFPDLVDKGDAVFVMRDVDPAATTPPPPPPAPPTAPPPTVAPPPTPAPIPPPATTDPTPAPVPPPPTDPAGAELVPPDLSTPRQ
ncbi:hypothetical protein BH20ACT2_BH20ACT2_22750 [soil metagenome]